MSNHGRRILVRVSIFGFIVAALTAGEEAQAACPGIYAGLYCDGGAANLICVRVSSTRIDCDLKANGDSLDTTSYYLSPSSTSFRAYGSDANGDDFCCEYTVDDECDGNGIVVNIDGGNQEHELQTILSRVSIARFVLHRLGRRGGDHRPAAGCSAVS